MENEQFIIEQLNDKKVLKKVNCTDAHVVVPEGVTEIGYQSFKDKTRLQSVELPNTVTTIRREAFRLCTKLKDINIPDSVTDIEDDAFKLCLSLDRVITFNNRLVCLMR